jgi:hypothetical protein
MHMSDLVHRAHPKESDSSHEEIVIKLTWYKINLTRPKRGSYDKQT